MNSSPSSDADRSPRPSSRARACVSTGRRHCSRPSSVSAMIRSRLSDLACVTQPRHRAPPRRLQIALIVCLPMSHSIADQSLRTGLRAHPTGRPQRIARWCRPPSSWRTCRTRPHTSRQQSHISFENSSDSILPPFGLVYCLTIVVYWWTFPSPPARNPHEMSGTHWR